jgi:zinc/manganese transport system permease protein
VSVGLSSLAIGAILSTALLIGPAAAALRLTTRVARALIVACLLGVLAVGLGVLLAYDSYYWGSSHLGLPVSFFVVAVVFVTYLGSGLTAAWAGARRRRQPAGPSAERDKIAGQAPREPSAAA